MAMAFCSPALMLLLFLPSAHAGHYAPVGGPGEVAVDEGSTIGAYKPQDCPADSHNCFTVTPDKEMCEDACDHATSACHSFAYCTGIGNPGAPFARCYLKTKKIDFMMIPHPTFSCSTYDAHGAQVDFQDFYVARNEGANLASFKPDCTEEPLDFCIRTTPTFDSCNASCAAQDACNSFAYCPGGGTGVDFTRCYLKTADFSKRAHTPGDCTTYYPANSATCHDVKNYFKTQDCCGAPAKDLDMNKAKAGGKQSF